MKSYLLFIFSCFSALLGVPQLSAASSGLTHRVAPVPDGPHIRVLLAEEVASAILEVRGAYKVIDSLIGTTLSKGKLGKRFVVHSIQEGLRWGEEYPDVFQISIVPTKGDTLFYVNGIQYQGAITIFHARNNHITVINELKLEDFLKATLAAQIGDCFSKEAIAAMAIVARTEAYRAHQAFKNSNRLWDLSADEVGYAGYAMSGRNHLVNEAIDWSRFMVLESVKNTGAAPHFHLRGAQAESLAGKGLDAQAILKNLYPSAKIGSTIKADEVAIR